MSTQLLFMGAASLGLAAASCGAGFRSDDIEFWVGEGANEAALVIDWNGGDDPVSLAWGFRWDGVATGHDMLVAVIHADARLYGRLASFGFGDVVIGLGHDTDGDGFGISDGTDFGPDGLAFAGPSDGAVADDSDDRYAEGWDTGFWSYWLGDGEPHAGGTWIEPQVGFGDRELSNGDWDGWRFAPGFVSSEPREPVAAVPGPGVLGVLVVGTALGVRHPVARRRVG